MSLNKKRKGDPVMNTGVQTVPADPSEDSELPSFGLFDGGFEQIMETAFNPLLAEAASPVNVDLTSLDEEKAFQEYSEEFGALEQLLAALSTSMEETRATLRQAFNNFTEPLMRTIALQIRDLHARVAGGLDRLEQIRSSVFLPPQSLHRHCNLSQGFRTLQVQLELFDYELVNVETLTTRSAAAFVINSQPLSRSIIKGGTVHIEVQLLIGAFLDLSEIKRISRVTAELIILETNDRKKGKPIIPYLEQNVEDLRGDGTARFNIKFPVGTGKKPVKLRFTVVMHYSSRFDPLHLQNQLVESQPSNSFIVTTNSIQWKDSEGILLKQEAFSTGAGQQLTEISPQQFINTLHVCYTSATRQSLDQPMRPLCAQDIDYLLVTRLLNAPSIHEKLFLPFWDWFGATLEKIRHQKHIANLYIAGFLHAFVSKQQTEAILRGQPEGTFVIRFSERKPGHFAIGYRVGDQEVKHYLVKPSDTAGNKKTLVDFLKPVAIARHVVQRMPDGNLRRLRKQDAFREYYNADQDEEEMGYDEFPSE